MNLVRGPLEAPDSALPEVSLRIDRQTLSRRIWRGAADDGTEFGFELEAPLRHGQAVAQTANGRYVIRQNPEPLLEIPLDVAADAAAVVGWAVGNLHFAIDAKPHRLLTPDDPGLRQALDRLGVHYRAIADVFQPHRLSASLAGHGFSMAKAPTIIRV